MKHQTLFSSKDKKVKKKALSAAILLDCLRLKITSFMVHERSGFNQLNNGSYISHGPLPDCRYSEWPLIKTGTTKIIIYLFQSYWNHNNSMKCCFLPMRQFVLFLAVLENFVMSMVCDSSLISEL